MMKWCNKILNSPKLRTEEQQQDGQVSLQDEDFIAGEPQLVDNKKLPNIVQEDEEFLSTSTSSSSKARISEIIELKLLIANQQAAIDTLSYKLHNLELAHHRLELDASLHSTKSEGLLRQLSTASSSSVNITISSSSGSRWEEYRNQQLVNENLELRWQLQDMKKFGNVGDSRNDRKFLVQWYIIC